MRGALNVFRNKEGKEILLSMVKAVQANKTYLSELDGLTGDGDHGMNMNKGFSVFEERFKDREISFTAGLGQLGTILLTEIGGSMGPIYGTIFIEMAEAGEKIENIGLEDLTKMFESGFNGLSGIVDAKVGDKTIVDTLAPAVGALKKAVEENLKFKIALEQMQEAAKRGKESTKDLIAKFGRSSRLGERSRGVLDAGATSCFIILAAIADAITALLIKEDFLLIK